MVSIDVYDIRGKKIKNLINRELMSGSFKAVWDGTSFTGTPVASGVYFLHTRIGPQQKINRLTLIK